jgi:hypothetical protein
MTTGLASDFSRTLAPMMFGFKSDSFLSREREDKLECILPLSFRAISSGDVTFDACSSGDSGFATFSAGDAGGVALSFGFAGAVDDLARSSRLLHLTWLASSQVFLLRLSQEK